MTPAELAELDDDRARARRFFWAWLALSTAMTLAGNAAAAVLDRIDPVAVRLAVHLIPPLIALVAVDAVAVLARAGAIHRARGSAGAGTAGHTVAVATAAVIAGLAAVLSYAGLVAVARAGGLAPGLAAVWPLVIDLGIGLSSAALLIVLRPISAADLRSAREAARAARATAPTASSAPAPAAPSAAPAASLPAAPSAARPVEARVSSDVRHTVEAVTVTQEHLDRAEALLQRGTVAKPVDDIAHVLALLDGGISERRTSAITGWSTNTVAKVRKADATTPVLAAV